MRVKRMRIRSIVVGVAALALLAAGVAPRADADLTPLPRIAVLEGRLTDSATGKTFTPRGFNYIRLASAGTRTYHSTFEPGQYDAARADAFLAQLRRGGYNTVRVFIDQGNIADVQAGLPHGLGRGGDDRSSGHPRYYDNVADFVRRAAAHRIYVMPTIDMFPQNARYYGISGKPIANVEGYNALLMKAGAIKAKRQYAQDFVTELRERLGAPLMTTLFALSLENEATWHADQAPFSRYQGSVIGPDGKTYDMAKTADRQQVADASIVLYASHGRAGARAADPDLLVTIGTFTHAAVAKKGPDGFAHHCSTECDPGYDYRYPARALMLSRYAGLDFLDVHSYPGGQRTLDGDLASIEWSGVRGIVVMGEFGTYKQHYGGNITAAAYAARDHQVRSCAKGFDGWLFWTWDTSDTAGQQRLFTGAESQGAINGVLAPIARPDPCRA